MTTEPSHLDYYTRHGISPVRQDILDLGRHFERREALYRSLGLPPLLLRGRSVAEVGPGSGHNSLYTASLSPARYVLIEPNPAGVASIRELLRSHEIDELAIDIVQQPVAEFRPGNRFEVVFCEGLLAGVPEPESLLRQLVALTDTGGVLVVTSEDYISKLPETLRRLFAWMILGDESSLERQVERLIPVFSPHLKTLKAMSRRHDDWIIDNLLNPASVGRELSMARTIETVSSECTFYSSSPAICKDWRWYKSIDRSNAEYNERAIVEYWENAHNFLDYRQLLPIRNSQKNRSLYRLCREIRFATGEYEGTRSPKTLDLLQDKLDEVVDNVKGTSSETTSGLQEACDLLKRSPVDADAIAASEHFGPFFGRGQQYLSFLKN